jgi:HEAT repeat protein
VLFRRDLSISFEAAVRDLASDNVRVRVAAADALGDVPDGEDRPAAAAALTRALGDARFEVRRSALLSLGELGALAPIDELAARLDDDHGEVRQAAAIALGRLGDARGFEPLLRALADGPPDVRFQAAPSLVEIDAERAYEPLVAAIRDGDAEVRGSVATALGFIGDRRAAGWIAGLLEDGRAETRFEAACALARLDDPRGIDTLIPYVERDPDHAFAAIEALESLRAAAAAPALARVAKKLLGTMHLRVRAAGALLLVAPAHPDAAWARGFLEKSARSRRPEVKGLAEEALARLAGKPLPADED